MMLMIALWPEEQTRDGQKNVQQTQEDAGRPQRMPKHGRSVDIVKSCSMKQTSLALNGHCQLNRLLNDRHTSIL